MPCSLRPAALAFDLDGTLIDSAPDIGHALNEAMASESLDSFDVAQVIEWIGDGPDGLIERALAHHGIRQPQAERRQRLRAAYDAAALAAPLGRGRPYPGIAELLAATHGRWPLVVVTNKPPVLAQAVLEAAGLLGRFVRLHGPARRQERKPEPFLLNAAAAELGIAASELLMVGDSLADLGAAAAAGCPVAYAGWGYGKPGTRERYPDSLPLTQPLDLLGLLAD